MPMSGGGEVPLGFAQESPGGSMPAAQHKVMIAHTAFKALALIMYLFSGFGSGYVVTFVMVTVLSALDFWTGARRLGRSGSLTHQIMLSPPAPSLPTVCASAVKNVSGRLLVGLRWWNRIDGDGKSHWHFMSFEDQRVIHPTDSNVFWLGLFIAPGVWILLAISTVRRRRRAQPSRRHTALTGVRVPADAPQVLTFHFMWLVLVLVALSSNMTNVIGYVKCKRDAGRKLSAFGGSVLTKGFDIWSTAQARVRGGAGERVPQGDAAA